MNSSHTDLQKNLNAALAAVSKACQLCRRVQSTLISADTVQKKDRSPVTVADLGSQAVVTLELLKALPDVAIVGEEDAQPFQGNEVLQGKVLELVQEQVPGVTDAQMCSAIDLGTAGKGDGASFWTLDPIDGTKGFLRGEQYAIALALIENGELQLGVLGCPNLPVQEGQPDLGTGCLFYAVKGQGAFLRPIDGGEARKISVDSTSASGGARFCESVESGHASHDEHAQISSLLGITAAPYRIDSQCKYGAVARGDASIYLRLSKGAEYKECIWDHAAGAIVVQEAGGKVTDAHGKALDFTAGRKLTGNTGVIATNGHLHQAVLEAVAKVLDQRGR